MIVSMFDKGLSFFKRVFFIDKFVECLLRNKTVVDTKPIDKINRNYVCLSADPINTINDLREGDWNMDSVYESIANGFLRYAKQSEVEKAIEEGRIKLDR